MKEKVKKKPWPKRLLQWLFPWKGDGAGEVIRKIIFLIALIVLIGALGFLGNYLWGRFQSQQVADEIARIYAGQDAGGDSQDTTPVSLPDGYNPRFGSLYQINPDIKGWISIDGTSINYPVVQSKDNDYYLHRNIYKKYDSSGVPFMDYRNNLGLDGQSDNLVIYGHHMNFDGMFGPLTHYKELDFYKAHPVITFDSVYHDMKWKIVSAFYAETQGDNVFDYQNYIDLSDPAAYDTFTSQIASRSYINTGVDIQQGDQFITLSTCANDSADGRVVVVARRVRDGEDPNVDTSQATAR